MIQNIFFIRPPQIFGMQNLEQPLKMIDLCFKENLHWSKNGFGGSWIESANPIPWVPPRGPVSPVCEHGFDFLLVSKRNIKAGIAYLSIQVLK